MMDKTNQPFEFLTYCTRCCMPETNEGIGFDEMGICKACISQEQKMRINWKEKENQLQLLIDDMKSIAGSNYDCIVPISGGKDSAFQLYVLKFVYGVNPLAVTFSHNWFSPTGWENLWNVVEKFDVDHIMYTPKRSLVNRMAKASLPLIGDSCWHCHQGVMAFPLQIAVKYGVRYIVWGESPADFSGRDTYSNKEFSCRSAKDIAEIIMKGSARVGPEALVSESIKPEELKVMHPPTSDQLVASDIKSFYLGDYVFWDHERQTEFLVTNFGWKEDKVEGTYKRYKSVECIMPGVHDYAKYIKRGFGRGTDFASQDVRAGIMTREEAFKVAVEEDSKRPPGLDYYLEITGYTEDEFIDTLKSLREGKAKELP